MSLVFGQQGNPLAGIWGLNDVDPTTSYATGGKTQYCFRDPCLVKTKTGALLCFVQANQSQAASQDSQVNAVYCKRSTNNGATWGAPILIYVMASPVVFAAG